MVNYIYCQCNIYTFVHRNEVHVNINQNVRKIQTQSVSAAGLDSSYVHQN